MVSVRSNAGLLTAVLAWTCRQLPPRSLEIYRLGPFRRNALLTCRAVGPVATELHFLVYRSPALDLELLSKQWEEAWRVFSLVLLEAGWMTFEIWLHEAQEL